MELNKENIHNNNNNSNNNDNSDNKDAKSLNSVIENKNSNQKEDEELLDLGLTEQEALELLKETDKIDDKKVIKIYGSSVSGNRKIKEAQNKMIDTLTSFNIPFEFVDLAADDQAKLFIRRKMPNLTTIPQLYINDEFKMVYDEFAELLEYDELFDVLGVQPS